MKKKRKGHTLEKVPKSIRKIVYIRKIDTLKTDIHDHSLFRLGTGTEKSGEVKLVLCAQNFM
jgi:hypothetical protein